MIRLYGAKSPTNQMLKDKTRKKNQSHKMINEIEGENKKIIRGQT